MHLIPAALLLLPNEQLRLIFLRESSGLKFPLGSKTRVIADNPADSIQPSLTTLVINKYANGDGQFRQTTIAHQLMFVVVVCFPGVTTHYGCIFAAR
jgi:hypothetical protein